MSIVIVKNRIKKQVYSFIILCLNDREIFQPNEERIEKTIENLFNKQMINKCYMYT